MKRDMALQDDVIAELKSDPAVASLSNRERDVMGGVVRGLTNKEMGIELGISHRTVEIHRARLMRKLHVTTLAALLEIAFAEREQSERRAARG